MVNTALPRGAGGIDGIGGGSIDLFDVMTGAGDRDAGRIGFYFYNLLAVAQTLPVTRGMNFDFPCQASIESQVNWPGTICMTVTSRG